MKRRAVLIAGGAGLIFAAAPSFGQAPKASRRIAFLLPGTEAGYRIQLQEFRTALKELGYVEGHDISIDVRWSDGRTERLASLAAELLASNPAVIVTASSEGVSACKKATSSIPIVFATAGAVVEQGFVASLRRPGGNITGVALHSQLDAKITEVIREALPSARRLAVLVHDMDRFHKMVLDSFEPAARSLKFELMVVRVSRAEDFERAFKELTDRKADALYVPNIALLTANRERIIEHALKARLPHFSVNPAIAAAGGLLSYGTLLEENYRRAAALVDKILRGA
ncbi:MAG: ABC transporter substrate-binding protein, partial [Terriglobales bacterium]